MKLKDIKTGLVDSQARIKAADTALSEALFVLSRKDLTTGDVEDAKARIHLAITDLDCLLDAQRDALESVTVLEQVYQQASGLLLSAFSSDIDDLRQTVDQSKRVRVIRRLPDPTDYAAAQNGSGGDATAAIRVGDGGASSNSHVEP